MTYQGNCAGSYIQETTYKYVGEGAGDFEPVKIPGSNVVVICGGGVGVLFLGLLIFLLLPAAATTTTTTSAPKPSFDCNAGFQNWESAWTPAKKAYCCAHTGRGCPTTVAPTPPPTTAPIVTTVAPSTRPPPPVTPAPPNECQMGGVATWSPQKKAYC